MSAFDKATLQKILVEINFPESCPWKQNGTMVMAALIILKFVINWRSLLQSVTITEEVCYYYCPWVTSV